mgnify:CR=1 FL=1
MLYPLKPLCYPLKSDEVAIITRARNQGTDFDRAHPSRGGQARRKVYIYRYRRVSFHTPHPVLWVSPACKGYGSRHQLSSSTTETGRWISRKKISERGSLRTCPAHQGGGRVSFGEKDAHRDAVLPPSAKPFVQLLYELRQWKPKTSP